MYFPRQHRKDELAVWRVCVAKDWEFDDTLAISVITGYLEIPGIKKAAETFITQRVYDEVGVDDDEAIVDNKDVMRFRNRLYDCQYRDGTKGFYKVACIKTGKEFPLMISGNPDIGDKVMLLKGICDKHDRNLGIVMDNSFRRKGVFFYPKMETFEDDTSLEYESYEFPLYETVNNTI